MGAVYKANLDGSGIDYSDPFLTTNMTYSRFGFSIVTVDFNADGIDDLAVSAPTYGSGGPTEIDDSVRVPKLYFGKVLIYLGKAGVGIVKNALPDYTIRTNNGTEVFFNLGHALRASDCDGDGKQDLIIMSPFSTQGWDQRGHISVIMGGVFPVSEYFEKTILMEETPV